MWFEGPIRQKQVTHDFLRQAVCTAAIVLTGFGLGVFSKYLDYRQTDLPRLLALLDQGIDLHNFLGELAPWLLLCAALAAYSRTPVRAAVNVFGFLSAMLAGYYLYCAQVAGFFPKSYALIWAGLTVLSPLPAFLCWYAKGQGPVAIGLSAAALAVFISTTCSYGFWYFSVRSLPDAAVLLLAVLLFRRPLQEMLPTLVLSALLAIVLQMIFPF